MYAKGASGDAAPIATLGGANTKLSSPNALVVDPAGRLWVSNGNNTVTAYAPGADGNATPVAVIAGAATQLNGPQAVAIDGSGDLLIANMYGESLTEYPLTASGNASPIRVITGNNTGLDFPDGLDVDTYGNIYVANQFGASITEYPANANGNAAPGAVITGSGTGLSAPGHLAVAPPLSILTHRLPVAVAHHYYRTTVRAGLGTPAYRWSITRGHLPRGLRLVSRTGKISGTPRGRGRYVFTVRVVDAARPRMTATARLSIRVGEHR